MKKTHLHFMGIGGQGISAVAQMAQLNGARVSGCDQRASATTQAIERAGIPVQIGHSAEHLADVDMLVVSPAVAALDKQNPELLAAQQSGIQVITWQELLGELMQNKCLLSVCGVHGKGTTTAMLSLMLVDAGLDPTCEIGGVVPRFGANYRLGTSQYFVNEADEFNHNFWHYHPRVAVVTSIEFEHPEFYADYEAFLQAFEHFIRGMDTQGDWSVPATLILNADSPGCLELRQRLHDWPGRVLAYRIEGLQPSQPELANIEAVFEAYDLQLDGATSFRVRTRGATEQAAMRGTEVFQLQLPGLHNIQNALGALVAARCLGVEGASIARTLAEFGGLRRRFEIRYQGPFTIGERAGEVILVDDYAHHPTAIAATLEAVRRRYQGRRVVAVYQPHMYSRTKTFFAQFLSAFDAADLAIIADIFPARERDTGLIHARDLVAALAERTHFKQHAQVLYGGSVEDTAHLLAKQLRSGDIVIIMGAGDIYTVTEALLKNTIKA
ncbi:UDP-N-acetylmuramate--L-alanine ligase [Ktedonosporobacter rubrisoli]|uniref:UDP-N-acetylmuramate--L-alanine ligase n=1 Tax=Ktedonosporobacter rubrisoli TaxID=2509675 RepID=A0A4P6K096_KTERU|nr:UDP-N-acetylmuramate--L-alanine ligase [Ktedonosporobacter rubrisoli]QBD81192.1 UDP-N-acetylmuramate--L-alanine ligase [Ktedonosporobacter rubrisoli]